LWLALAAPVVAQSQAGHPPLPDLEGGRWGISVKALDGQPLGEFPVVALQSVPQAGVLGRAWDTLRLWFK